ncbi:hypothetical protein EB001_08330 [bacterium]|nr:hypothetical protein [bacterium]
MSLHGEYTKLHLISLEQDAAHIQKQLDDTVEFDTDEYRDLEVEDVSNNGQIIATRHLLETMEEML